MLLFLSLISGAFAADNCPSVDSIDIYTEEGSVVIEVGDLVLTQGDALDLLGKGDDWQGVVVSRPLGDGEMTLAFESVGTGMKVDINTTLNLDAASPMESLTGGHGQTTLNILDRGEAGDNVFISSTVSPEDAVLKMIYTEYETIYFVGDGAMTLEMRCAKGKTRKVKVDYIGQAHVYADNGTGEKLIASSDYSGWTPEGPLLDVKTLGMFASVSVADVSVRSLSVDNRKTGVAGLRVAVDSSTLDSLLVADAAKVVVSTDSWVKKQSVTGVGGPAKPTCVKCVK